MPGHAAPSRAVFAWALLVAGVLSARPTHAGDLQVAPISLEIAAQEQAQTLTLSNSGDRLLRAQVRVMAWSQDGGSDELQPTRLLLASPPIVEIAPHAQQLIRIIRPDGTPPAHELAYRLIVDELPDPALADTSGLKLLLRYSIPVFVLPPGVVPALSRTGTIPPTDLSAISARLQGGELAISNAGTTRLKISALAWVNPDGSRVVLNPGLQGYVLAGEDMHWPLTLPTAAKPGGSLRAHFNGDADEQALALDRTGH
jgi:fimbrial chaperone protein